MQLELEILSDYLTKLSLIKKNLVVTPEVLQMWWLVLEDLSLEDVEHGFREVAKSRQYGDTEPADVREAALQNLIQRRAKLEARKRIEQEEEDRQNRIRVREMLSAPKDPNYVHVDFKKLLDEKFPNRHEKGLSPINQIVWDRLEKRR